MSGSILIFSGNKEQRQHEIERILSLKKVKVTPNNPDIQFVQPLEDKKSIGIDQVRLGIKFLGNKPFASSIKVLVIPSAELLTVESQNALLKTLEEPPEYGLVILAAKTENALLPTILSRCLKTQLKADPNDSPASIQTEVLDKLMTDSIGNRLVWAEENAKEEKEDVIDTLETWLDYLHTKLITTKDANTLKTLAATANNITKVKGDLEKTNINLKLALEWLMVQLVETNPNIV